MRAPSRWLVRSRREDDAPRALLVAVYDPSGLGTIVDYVDALVQRSRLRVDVLNLFYCPFRDGAPQVPESFSLEPYQCVIVHPTASYDPQRLLAYEARGLPLGAFRGVKAVLKQDEHYRIARTREYLRAARIDIVATCMERDEAKRVYGLPQLELLPVLPGYVSPRMLGLRYRPLSERPIDIGYRGSPQPWSFGRLSYEKWEIGERFRAVAPAGMRTDISGRWEDRFFGRAWFDFLGLCKATLGVESGAEVFDEDGTIDAQCRAYITAHPGAGFEEVFAAVLAPHEGKVRYRTVSPRHFEAAATRTLQILYEGEYRGILEPWRHYVPLRRDFANLDEVLGVVRDGKRATGIIERAYAEVAANPAYSYAAFVRQLDDALFARLQA